MCQHSPSDSQTIIAFVALLVSIVSVVFTYLALRHQRVHNIKSVKPIGQIIAGDYEHDIYIRIDNNGTGPLIIKKLEVRNESLSASSVIDILPSDLVNRIFWKDFTNNINERAILPEHNLVLIRWVSENYDKTHSTQMSLDKRDLRVSLKDLVLKLEYTDIYERNIFSVERRMDWFARNTN